MNAVILERHNGSPQPTTGRDLVPGLQFVQHSLPFFLLPLLGQDQEKIENGEDKYEWRDSEPSHATATGLYRQYVLHARRGLNGCIRKSSRHPPAPRSCYLTTGF